MFCEECGAPLPDGAAFCDRCGRPLQEQDGLDVPVPGPIERCEPEADLTAPRPPVVPGVTPPDPVAPRSARTPKQGRGAVVAVCVAAVVLVGVGVWLFGFGGLGLLLKGTAPADAGVADVTAAEKEWVVTYGAASVPVVAADTRIVFCDPEGEPLESFSVAVGTNGDSSPTSYRVTGSFGIQLDQFDVSDPGAYDLTASTKAEGTYPTVTVRLADAAEQDGTLYVRPGADGVTFSAEEPVAETEPANEEAPAPEKLSAASGDYVLADSASRAYSESELSSLTDYQLFLARNEIYARHGRRFKNAELQRYFSSKPWYTPLYEPDAFSDDLLSSVEKQNAEAMLAIERSRGSAYLG